MTSYEITFAAVGDGARDLPPLPVDLVAGPDDPHVIDQLTEHARRAVRTSTVQIRLRPSELSGSISVLVAGQDGQPQRPQWTFTLRPVVDPPHQVCGRCGCTDYTPCSTRRGPCGWVVTTGPTSLCTACDT